MCFFAVAQKAICEVRQIEFEWDAIEHAKSYEVQLTNINNQIKITQATTDSKWSGQLKPGNYQVLIRSVDLRNVPGDWSDPIVLTVLLNKVVPLKPMNKGEIQSNNDEIEKIEFKWKAIEGATTYLINVYEENGNQVHQQETSQTELSLDFDVARNYQWTVKAKNDFVSSEESEKTKFFVKGKKLEAPEVENPSSYKVEKLTWKQSKFAEYSEIQLSYLNENSEKWTFKHKQNSLSKNELTFNPQWPNGKYKIKIRSHAKMRSSSDWSELDFQFSNGSELSKRFPAQISEIRESIDRYIGWFGVASYLVTQMNYQSTNYDSLSSVQYQALGGTGRLGIGYFDQKDPIGYLLNVDLSGYIVQQKISTFASFDLSKIHRYVVGEMGELRLFYGLYYKELPETIRAGVDTDTETTNKIVSAVGLHTKFEYWHSINSKIGIQSHLQIYLPIFRINSAFSGEFQPIPSSQVGFLGSYRWSQQMTGLVGIVIRRDQFNYRSQSSGREGELNTTIIDGQYLNLYTEWSFE